MDLELPRYLHLAEGFHRLGSRPFDFRLSIWGRWSFLVFGKTAGFRHVKVTK